MAHGVNVPRVTAIGPLPPRLHGQSVAFSYLVQEFSKCHWDLKIIDTGDRESNSSFRLLVRLWRTVQSCWAAIRSDSVYIAVKAGRGMWINTVAAGVARLVGTRVFLHHHSYAYVRTRKLRMVALARAAGPNAQHIVLSRSMADQLRSKMPEVRRTLILGNACLVDRQLATLPLRRNSPELTLGHLSNLTLAKGIAETVDLAVALHRSGVRARLLIAGPADNLDSLAQLRRASVELGDSFEYLGPITGRDKLAFFEQISHFVFPSRYEHEAVPLVLYEAMASGVVCVATRQGAISEQLAGSPAVLAENSDCFVDDTIPLLRRMSTESHKATLCRRAYLRALKESDNQLDNLINEIGHSGDA